MLRAQYEKEGEMVGVQTKFNYAWVRISAHEKTKWCSNTVNRALSSRTYALSNTSA